MSAIRTQAEPVAGDGASSRVRDFSLEEPRRARRARRGVIGGLVMALVFALAAGLLHLRSVDKDPALVLVDAVPQGEVIEDSDVGVTYVSSDDAIARLSDADRARVVGQVARVDMPAGTLLTPAQLAEAPTLREGQGIVGLALEPGQVPRTGLVPGDRVNVVAGPASQGAAPVEDAAVLVEAAEVVSVEAFGSQERRFVSLRMAEADANRVAAAAERGPLRLVLVAR